jgi:hypothetical protein
MQAKNLSEARVLGTEAGGFIGSHLREYLLTAEGLEKAIQWFRARSDRSNHHLYYI